ncbi:MAG TPA: aspartate ammonia-lyase [Nitrososphaeraceae archaeon]|nr:aspartate ammonia-lyase [Nitrososphaeraceae archaeon]
MQDISSFRVDKDSLGDVIVPSNAYYGPFTARAKQQYNVTGQTAHICLIKAYIMIKRSAALANKNLRVLDADKANAIIKSCDEILDGRFVDQFVLDSINSGAGTAFNMNVNEVIANRSLEILGKKKGQYEIMSPNDHVNMSQSSNDTFPTAMHIAILLNSFELLSTVDLVTRAIKRKSEEFNDIIKIGRTHLMDALPVTLGNEFGGYAYSIGQARQIIMLAGKKLEFIGLGGTAVGTGANAPKGYRESAIKYLAEITQLDLKPSENVFYSLQSKLDVASYSSSLRNLALEFIKIANDIRLMVSGPTAGFAEIFVPPVHAGSSIMPGKVNPSLAECLNMICFNIIGNDVSVAMAAQAGQLELNVMLPGMLKCVLDSMDMLKNFLPVFAKNMIDGLRENRERIESYIEKSPALITLLNPYIGYLQAAEIYKESINTKTSIRDLILRKGLMTGEEIDRILSKENLLGSG